MRFDGCALVIFGARMRFNALWMSFNELQCALMIFDDL